MARSNNEFNGASNSARGVNADSGVIPPAADRFASSAQPSGAASEAPAATESPLQKHWSSRPEQRGREPFRPHSTVDSDGHERTLTASQQAENRLADAAKEEFNAKAEARKTADKTSEKRSSGRPSRSRVTEKGPTNLTPGVVIQRTMGIKEQEAQVNSLHSLLTTPVNTLNSFKMRPEAAVDHNAAKNGLDEAKNHLAKAAIARRGLIIDGKRISGDAEAATHLGKATKALRRVHDALSGPHLKNLAELNGVALELPTSHLENLETAADTSRVTKPGKSFQSIPFGGTDINPKNVDLKEAKDILGTEAPAVKKLAAAQKGTRRQDKFRVVSGQEEKSLGGLPGPEVRTPAGKGGAVTTPINPKRKASKTNKIEDRLAKANTSAYETPKFEAVNNPKEEIAGSKNPEAINAGMAARLAAGKRQTDAPKTPVNQKSAEEIEEGLANARVARRNAYRAKVKKAVNKTNAKATTKLGIDRQLPNQRRGK
jgi:hypothetical protein